MTDRQRNDDVIQNRLDAEGACGGGRRRRWFGRRPGSEDISCPRCMSREEHADTLSGAACGDRVRVRGHTGGERLASRLAEMGLFKGADLEVLSGGSKGPMIVRTGGSRLALGRGMALKILVESETDYRAAGD